MMHHQIRFIFICSFLCVTIAATNDIIDIPKESHQQSTVEIVSDDASSSSEVAGIPFETSHKSPYHNEFQTSHKISPDALQRRDDLFNSMKSKEKPELDEQLGELIAADIKSNIEAKRLSEYEKYVIEPLTTEKPVLATTEEGIAQSINEGLIDDFSILEEAGSENKQQSRIQIKKGPNGQDYEYEYVYYYYDDDEKNPEDSDVIVANRKSPSSSSTTTTTTTQAPESVNAGKISYTSIERGSSSSNGERNEIQSRGKGRAHQASPAPVVEDITDDRLPPATRFPQRSKSVNPAPVENAAPAESDEKDKNSQKGPRIIETELSKSELLETVSKTSIEYASSTVESPANDIEEEDTTPSMEKATFDLYAHIANENANEDEKKIVSADIEITTIENEDLTTEKDSDDFVEASPSTEAPTTTTTEATTTTTTTEKITTTTEEVTEATRRGGLTAGRNSNRFKFQGRTGSLSTTTSIPESTEATKGVKSRFNKPSFNAGGRSGGRTTKTTAAPVEENVEKSEVTQQQAAPANKFRSGGARNRFNLRNTASPSSTEKAAVNTEVETTTASRLVKPRPQFSLRSRSRSGASPSSTETPAQSNTETAVAENEQDKEENAVDKSSSSAPIVPRPTSRLNINRSGNRIAPTAGQRSRPSPLNRSRVNSNVDSNDDNKSANENESDAEATTQNNLNKLKSRPRIQINTESKAKKTTAQPVINRKVNPLISKRKFGVTSTTEAAVDETEENESDNAAKEGAKDVSESVNELKEEETTQAVEVTSEQPRGLGLLNRRKLVNRRPGTTN
ncbi:serine-rich adhesin for platelets isoform X2 [Chironomus tepperi]|uniref:serine-rich adhesin for platelets isoform X2 n=1 Tax=Chironomus tepperi TaxID=113505 RepID=UPI00391FB0A0